MENIANMSALIEVPVSILTDKYKELLASLTVDNPEYKTARFFGKGFVKKDIPKKLHFFKTNNSRKTISIPRGVDSSYFKDGGDCIQYDLSRGRKIGAGTDGSFKLRPKQQKYFDEVVFPFMEQDQSYNIGKNLDILLNAQCGSGKTIMALFLSDFYRRNTIVCVTKKNIGEGFIKTIKKFFPNWSCGWAEDGKVYDITIGTYALLSQNSYGADFFRNYGHIVLDEFHRCGAETYSKILEKAPCQFRTSLTATFRRKDGLHKILKLHAGTILEMERDEQVADVYPLSTGVSINEELFRGVGRFSTKFENIEIYSEVAVKDAKTKKEIDRGMISDLNKATREFTLVSSVTGKTITYSGSNPVYNLGIASATAIDTEISEISERNDIILKLVRECQRTGRKTLLLSKRKEQLFYLSKVFSRYGLEHGVFVSEKDKDYKKYCEKHGRTLKENEEYVFTKTPIILGIDKLAEEGMDVPHFDTIIYLHPIKDIEQSIGRVLRDNPEWNCPAKQKPVAFYLVDRVKNYTNAWDGKKEGAKKMFRELGHTVHNETTIFELLNLFRDGKI